MTIAQQIIVNTWMLFLEAAPWLLLGLVVAGLIRAWVPQTLLAQWLGGRGPWPTVKAALIGAPLPLCSCSVIPVAIGLHRSGASRASTTSFLVATPETAPIRSARPMRCSGRSSPWCVPPRRLRVR
jgi:hypothetical protein